VYHRIIFKLLSVIYKCIYAYTCICVKYTMITCNKYVTKLGIWEGIEELRDRFEVEILRMLVLILNRYSITVAKLWTMLDGYKSSNHPMPPHRETWAIYSITTGPLSHVDSPLTRVILILEPNRYNNPIGP